MKHTLVDHRGSLLNQREFLFTHRVKFADHISAKYRMFRRAYRLSVLVFLKRGFPGISGFVPAGTRAIGIQNLYQYLSFKLSFEFRNAKTHILPYKDIVHNNTFTQESRSIIHRNDESEYSAVAKTSDDSILKLHPKTSWQAVTNKYLNFNEQASANLSILNWYQKAPNTRSTEPVSNISLNFFNNDQINNNQNHYRRNSLPGWGIRNLVQISSGLHHQSEAFSDRIINSNDKLMTPSSFNAVQSITVSYLFQIMNQVKQQELLQHFSKINASNNKTNTVSPYTAGSKILFVNTHKVKRLLKEFPVLSTQTSSNILQPTIPVAFSSGMLFVSSQDGENNDEVIENSNLLSYNKMQPHLQQYSIQEENKVDPVRNLRMVKPANNTNNVITGNSFPSRNPFFIHLSRTTVGLLDDSSTKISLRNLTRLGSMVSGRGNQIAHQKRLVKPVQSAELTSYQPSRLVFKKVEVSPLKDKPVTTANHSLSTDTMNSKENMRQSNTENVMVNSTAVKGLRPDRELRQIADQVYRMLEKRIMIEKDKRGWLNGR